MIVYLFRNFKVVFPAAPIRFTELYENKENFSWFNIKKTNVFNLFSLPIDDAFSSKDILESYSKYIKPIIMKNAELLGGKYEKIFIGGFS